MAKKAISIKTGRGSDQFMVRLPEGMRDFIAQLAAMHGRSMNGEIVAALAMYCAESGSPEPYRASDAKREISNLRGEVRKLSDEVAKLQRKRS
jgi:plasmid stability protein